MPYSHSIITHELPRIDSFLVSLGKSPVQSRQITEIDLNWKEQRYNDLLEKANRCGLSDDEKDELDEIGADLNEAASLAAWGESELRGGF